MNKDKNHKKLDVSASSKPSQQHQKIGRREFLAAASGTVAAFTIVPRQVMGGAKHVAPSEKINVGYIGTGTQGIRNMMGALRSPELRIVSVCDPNKDSSDYVAWSRNEVRNKIRAFLNKPKWGEGQRGCRCGREVGREIVDSYYAMSTASGKYKACSAYSDFRELLENENDLDAAYIMTPDHLHATVAVAAMKKRQACYYAQAPV